MHSLRGKSSVFWIIIIIANVTSGQKQKEKSTCAFNILPTNQNDTLTTLEILYDNNDWMCLDCSPFTGTKVQTLVPRGFRNILRQEQLCKRNCNGVLCNTKPGNSSCSLAGRNFVSNEDSVKQCPKDRSSRPVEPKNNVKAQNQVPLIIGFAVGGVMLAVVIAGVFLGRSNRSASPSDSDIATTPVSMSYSEWISNYSTGGRGSKPGNLRVQETDSLNSQDGYPPMDVYNIVYSGNNFEPYHDEENGPTIIEVDETLGMDDAFQDFPPEYYPETPQNCLLPQIEETTPLHGLNQLDAAFGVISPKEELNNNNKGSKHPADCFYKDSFVGWPDGPDYINFEEHSPSISDKRRSFGQWSDESEFDIHHLRQMRSSFRSRQQSYDRNSLNSTKSSRFSKKFRKNYANLTHVFVDVHRNMTYSCDDMTSMGNVSTSYRRDSDVIKSICSIKSVPKQDSLMVIGENLSYEESRKKSCDSVFYIRRSRRLRRFSL